MKQLPDVMLLANGSKDALAILEARMLESDGVTKRLIGCRLAPILAERFSDAGFESSSAFSALQPHLGRNLAWAAQLQLAMLACAEFAQGHNVELLLIKGAANAAGLYPRASLRLGNDVDVVMRPDDLERVWPGAIAEARSVGVAIDHLDRKYFQGMPIEFHYRWGYESARWGTAVDCFRDSTKHADHVGLRLPAFRTALTITLTHAYKERGMLPFDWVDLSLLLPQVDDWDVLVAFWEQHRLIQQVLPALLVANRAGLEVSEAVICGLRRSLDRSELAKAETLAGFMLSTRHRFMREEWMEARLADESFLGRCWPKLAGSPDVTERLTGLKPGMPGYAWQHYCALPAKRIRRLF